MTEIEEQPLLRPRSKLTQAELERILSDIRNEPKWRELADKCHRYYDGAQRDSKALNMLRSRGLSPVVRNEIAPAIDIVLGMEAKNKTRGKVVSDSKEQEAEDVARALTSELIKTERQTRTGRASSDAYGSQIKAGVGWVEVAEEDNKFLGDFRVQAVNRNEIFYDWRRKRPDLIDSRWLVRRQFLDKDIVLKMFPKHKELIKGLVTDWADWDDITTSVSAEYLVECQNLQETTSVREAEWITADRKRLCVYEVWYRVYEDILAFTDQNGIVREFDKKNMRHIVLVAKKLATLSKMVVSKVRLSWWIGCHLISDEPSKYNHNFYPYVPFWGFIDDESNQPYSAIKRAIPLQDNINARETKLIDLLSSKRVTMDSDAIAREYNSIGKIREQAASANSFFILNPERKNIDGFKVETDLTIADRQAELIQSSVVALKSVIGINDAMQGQSPGRSGVAENALIEQGNTGIAEQNDNYRYARTLVSELLLAGIKKKIGSKKQTITIDNTEKSAENEFIELNNPAVTDEGLPYIANSVMQSRTEVEIEEIPSHQSVKQQQFTDMLDFTKKLPPEYMAAVAPFLALTSDLEFKKEISDIFKKMSGQGSDDLTPQEQQAQQLQQLMEDLLRRKEEASVAKEEALAAKEVANTDKIKSETVNNKVESTYSAVQSAGSLAQMPNLIPTADSILQSSGFEDENEYPVATVEPVQMTDGIVPEQQDFPVERNTSPMLPPRPQTPVNGMNTGIETQTTRDNLL